MQKGSLISHKNDLQVGLPLLQLQVWFEPQHANALPQGQQFVPLEHGLSSHGPEGVTPSLF